MVLLIPELCFLTGIDDRLERNFTTMRKLTQYTEVEATATEETIQNFFHTVKSNINLTKLYYPTALLPIKSFMFFR